MATTKALELAQLADSISVNANGEITNIGTLSSLDISGDISTSTLSASANVTFSDQVGIGAAPLSTYKLNVVDTEGYGIRVASDGSQTFFVNEIRHPADITGASLLTLRSDNTTGNADRAQLMLQGHTESGTHRFGLGIDTDAETAYLTTKTKANTAIRMPLDLRVGDTNSLIIDSDRNTNVLFDLNVSSDLDVTANASIGGALSVTGNASVSGNLSVSGDFTVSGNTTYVNTNDLIIEDTLIYLASGATTPAQANTSGIAITATADANNLIEDAHVKFNHNPNGEETWNINRPTNISASTKQGTDTVIINQNGPGNHAKLIVQANGSGASNANTEVYAALELVGRYYGPNVNSTHGRHGIIWVQASEATYDQDAYDTDMFFGVRSDGSTYNLPGEGSANIPSLVMRHDGDIEVLRKDLILNAGTNQKLGLGTDSPAAKLHVRHDGTGLRLQTQDSGINGSFIDFYEGPATGGRRGFIGYPSNSSDDLYIHVDTDNKIRFQTNNSITASLESGDFVLNQNDSTFTSQRGNGDYSGEGLYISHYAYGSGAGPYYRNADISVNGDSSWGSQLRIFTTETARGDAGSSLRLTVDENQLAVYSGTLGLQKLGTASSANTEYNSRTLQFTTSSWDVNNAIAKDVNFYVKATPRVPPDNYSGGNLDFSTNGGNDSPTIFRIFSDGPWSGAVPDSRSGVDVSRGRLYMASNLALTETRYGYLTGLTVNDTANSTIKIVDDTVNNSYGSYIKGYGVTGSGGRLELGVLDASVQNTGITISEQAKSVYIHTFDNAVGVNGTQAVRAKFDQYGNLGIGKGTTDASGRLEVVDGTAHASGFRNHSWFTMPNITGGGLSVGFGKSGSTRNLAKFVYNHSGDGSTANWIGLGFWDADNLFNVRADGYVGVGVTQPGTKLEVYGEGSGDGTYSSAQVTIGKTRGPKLVATQESSDNDVQGLAIFTKNSGNFSDTPTERLRVTNDGHVVPASDATYDLGSSTQTWRGVYAADIYSQDLHLSNENREEGNSVDGTKGDWTVQEGEEELFIINNKTGKKYAFMLREIE